MAWSDKPTDAQLMWIYDWIRIDARCGSEMASQAMKYLKNTADRRQVSDEMGRLRDLKNKRALNSKTCFESKIWGGFEYDNSKAMEILRNARV